MGKIIIRIAFALGVLDLILYMVSTFHYHKEIEFYRWVITSAATVFLGIYVIKGIKWKKN